MPSPAELLQKTRSGFFSSGFLELIWILDFTPIRGQAPSDSHLSHSNKKSYIFSLGRHREGGSISSISVDTTLGTGLSSPIPTLALGRRALGEACPYYPAWRDEWGKPHQGPTSCKAQNTELGKQQGPTAAVRLRFYSIDFRLKPPTSSMLKDYSYYTLSGDSLSWSFLNRSGNRNSLKTQDHLRFNLIII